MQEKLICEELLNNEKAMKIFKDDDKYIALLDDEKKLNVYKKIND